MGRMKDFAFDFAASNAAKKEGMELAANANPDLLTVARQVAKALALTGPNRRVSSDDVFLQMKRMGLPYNIGPVAGSLFKGPEWRFTGDRVRSKRISNHARELKVWELK
jgi:hypothetical protein|tara:strand:+ start:850 stop:1176 length:327 start_codon:yes stop_codon:yes gene_type:complete